LDERARFAADVRSGLCRDGQKELPSKYLYDAVGSALFETISVLPEYGLTRADERLLQRHAREIVRRLPKPVVVSELGSGSGKKTRPLLEALCGGRKVAYYPIEISAAALTMIQRELADIHCVSIVGLESEYLAGLARVAALRRRGEHLLVLFLGSTIGNFDLGSDVRFLRDVRQTLAPGDTLLLGADLIKPQQQLLDAYDDPAGVTAAFNRNLLARINRELDADFNLRHFEHEARFNEKTSSVEMHLRSLRAQVVEVRWAGFQVAFAAGETIWTESCHKYSLPELTALATAARFRVEAQWIDAEWPFAESLLVAV
jgi:dimethylhistidine N-methyltransferase